MIDCGTYSDLIARRLEGTISDALLDELKAHTDGCESCRKEFESLGLVQDIVQEAFSSQTSAEQASAKVLDRLAATPRVRIRAARAVGARQAWAHGAIAAAVLLAVGLTIGFGLGKATVPRPVEVTLPDQVPMRVSRLSGTVLVRHDGFDEWEALQPGATVRIGDTFHSAAKSDFTLELSDGSTIEVSQNSMLVLKSYDGETQFLLEHGRCMAALERPHPPFFIRTPHGQVAALGTEFTVTVE
jgi:ferric-dicitrate binding protein FerR (iron transport regulator)